MIGFRLQRTRLDNRHSKKWIRKQSYTKKNHEMRIKHKHNISEADIIIHTFM